jgi:hypothetical protein
VDLKDFITLGLSINYSGNYSGLSKILCEECAKNVNDCHPKACMGALDQKNNIAGNTHQPDEPQFYFTFPIGKACPLIDIVGYWAFLNIFSARVGTSLST